MNSVRNHALFLVFALIITACAVYAPPKSFDQELAYAYGTHTAILDAAANAVNLGTLSADDGERVLVLADQSQALLDSSRMLFGSGDLESAEGQLRLATNILTELKAYIDAKILAGAK